MFASLLLFVAFPFKSFSKNLRQRTVACGTPDSVVVHKNVSEKLFSTTRIIKRKSNCIVSEEYE